MKRHTFFLKTAAICSILGALTTALLIFLPNPVASDAAAKALLSKNSLYLTKKWILFLHPQVNFIASMGLALMLWKKYPTRMILGLFFLMVWAYSEMSQQALIIDGLNNFWRPGYLNAPNADSKQLFQTLIEGAKGFSSSQYFLIIYGFGIGSFLFGLALVMEPGLGRLIGISLLLIGIFSIAAFGMYYLGFGSLSKIINGWYQWVYAYLQPLVRIAIGYWIFVRIKWYLKQEDKS